MFRKKAGALARLYDVPASQLWIGAVAIGFRYADENAPSGTLAPAILALVSVSLVFFYLMGVNDYFDVDIDRHKEGGSVLVKGELTMNEAKVAVFLVAGLGLVFAMMVSVRFFAFACIIFVLSSLYSVPPVRYKRFYPYSTAGEVVGAFVLFMLGYSVIGLPSFTAVFISTLTTLVATGARLRQEARRVEFDGMTGKGTLAVMHGPTLVKAVSRALVLAAFVEVFVLRLYGLLSTSTTILASAFVIAPILVKQARDRRYLRAGYMAWGFCIYILAIFLPLF